MFGRYCLYIIHFDSSLIMALFYPTIERILTTKGDTRDRVTQGTGTWSNKEGSANENVIVPIGLA